MSPTLSAILPDTPISISSNISVGILSNSARTFLRASIHLDNSPLDAILERGPISCPGFAENTNSTASFPVSLTSTLSTLTSNLAFSSPRSKNSSIVRFLNSLITSFLFFDSSSALLFTSCFKFPISFPILSISSLLTLRP